MSDNFERVMGATERMRLWFPNINVVMAAHITGNVSQVALRDSIHKARKKHPLLGARVELGSDDSGKFKTDGVPEIPMDVMLRRSDRDWLEQMRLELEHRWPVTQGPLARFVLLHSNKASDLIVNAHHSICDARSLSYLIRDLLTFMTESVTLQEINPLVPVPLEDAVPQSASSGFLRRLVMNVFNKKWRKKGIIFTERDYRDMHAAFWRRHDATILSWSLTKAETALLIQRCRQHGVSVNSALYVAFLGAQWRVQGENGSGFDNVLVPVDFRNYLARQTGEALGLYASALHVTFNCTTDPSYWGSVEEFDRLVKAELTDKNIFASQRLNAVDPSLLDGVAFALFGDLDDKMARGMAEKIQAKMKTGILISNLGRLDLPVDYGDLHLAAIVPPAIYAGTAEKALEVLTIGGQMHLTLTFDPAIVARETVLAIKERAIRTMVDSGTW